MTLANFDDLDTCVQISPLTVQITKLLHLNQLNVDLAADTSLTLVPSSLRACVLQTLFICAGCDYFFCWLWEDYCFFESAWLSLALLNCPGH